MEISKDIFRAYDIRGLYPQEINEDFAEILGKALGTLFSAQGILNIVIGMDDRESSSSIVNSLSNGLVSTGINVIDTGITVQPALHYFTYLENIHASINVTASHNPGSFNGIKIDLKNAVPFFGEDLKKLRDAMVSGNFHSGVGTYTQQDLNPQYVEFISSKFKLSKPIKVVVYCGNGATSSIYPLILEKIGAEVVPLRCYFDSEFPVGLPNPESGVFYPELKAQVLESNADLGVGFDGDGDRVGEVDEHGKSYKADEIFLLYIKDVLSKNVGATIIYDVKTSRLVPQYITQYGGIPKIMPTGRAHFLNEIHSGSALLGCELSGHTYFKDDFLGFDDGIYAACRLLKIMDASGEKLSRLMKQFSQTYSTPELKYPISDEIKFKVVNNILKELETSNKYKEILKIDGVRVKVSPTCWFLIRASNTSPYLSVRIEGKDKSEVDFIFPEVVKLIEDNSK